MADSYRLSIFDQTGPDTIPDSKEESNVKNIGNSSHPKNSYGQTTSKGDNDSTIGLNSSMSSEAADTYGSEGNAVANNEDIFTERNANAYKLNDIQNEVNITGPEGEPYGKIGNVIADAFESSMSESSDAASYDKIKNVSQNERDGAAALLYGAIKEVVRNLGSSSSNSSSGGGGTNNAYAENQKDNVTGSGTDSAFGSHNGGGFTIPLGDWLNLNPNDLHNPTPVLNEPSAELSRDGDLNNGTDYADEFKDVYTSSISNTTDYDSYPGIDFEFKNEPASEIETITSPDAMSNMYDVYFRIRDDDGHDSRLLGKGQAFIKALFSSALLSARISKIDIPAYQRQTSVVNYASGMVEKPLDAIDTPGRSTFSIRADTKLAYISAFNELSGTSMSNLFGKGSSIKKGLDECSLAKIEENYEAQMTEWIKKQEKLDEAYAKDYKAAVEEDSVTIINEFIKNKKAKFSDEESDAYEKKIGELQDKYMKENGSLNGFYLHLQVMLESETMSNIENTKKKKAKESEAVKKAGGVFARMKAEREEKEKYRKQIDEWNEDLKSLNFYNHWEKRKIVCSDYTEKQEALDKEKEGIENVRAQGIKNLSYDKEGFGYVTETLSKNISVISTPASRNQLFNLLKSNKRLDIIVKRTTPSFMFRTQLTDKVDERFIFEDVKIIGSSDPIRFQRETAGPVDMTYEFIYKRFYKLDTYDEAGTWVTSQMSMFIDAAIDYALGKQTNMKRMELWAKNKHQNYINSVNASAREVQKSLNSLRF